MTAGDCMTAPAVTCNESDTLEDCAQAMASHRIRRMPIVDENGGVVGILTLDDLLELLSEELLAIAKLVKYQRQKETRHRQ